MERNTQWKKYAVQNRIPELAEKPSVARQTKNSVKQKASIKGQIVNGEDQTPIHGADVYLEKLSLGATSQVDGYFTINDIPSGEVIIRVSMIGFKDVDRIFLGLE